MSQRYHGKSSAPLPPHVYKVAERTHDCMLSTKTSQCCVISGESGAGKTETCKYLIQHLVFIAGSDESNLNSKISQVCSRFHRYVQDITGMFRISLVCSGYHRYVNDISGMFKISQVFPRCYRYARTSQEYPIYHRYVTSMFNIS